MIWHQLEHIMSPENNYARYRKVLAKRKESAHENPTLPYIGLFMKDMALIGMCFVVMCVCVFLPKIYSRGRKSGPSR